MKQKSRQFPSPTLSEHPLLGVRLSNFIQLLRRQQNIPPNKWPYLLAFATSALARSPFSLIERKKISQKEVIKKLESPIFIIGYWRSGTTHLHNLLARSPELGIITPLASGLPDELLTLGTWLQPLLKKGLPDNRRVDRVKVTPQSPQEDEIPLANLQSLSVFHALYFPGNFRRNFNRGVFFDGARETEIEYWQSQLLYFLGKVAHHQQKQPLLIKNPVYTARIDLLREIWPSARFVHIYRNPYRVYKSTIRYYHKMIQKLGLQAFDPDEIEPVVLESYPRMLNKMYRDAKNLPEHQFMEIRFEEVEENPLAVLKKIYGRLKVAGWQNAIPHTEAYLKSVSGYKKNTYKFNQKDFIKVDNNWKDFVNRWGYESPTINSRTQSQQSDHR